MNPNAAIFHKAVIIMYAQAISLMGGHPSYVRAISLQNQTEAGLVSVEFKRGDGQTIGSLIVQVPNGIKAIYTKIPSVFEINSII